MIQKPVDKKCQNQESAGRSPGEVKVQWSHLAGGAALEECGDDLRRVAP